MGLPNRRSSRLIGFESPGDFLTGDRYSLTAGSGDHRGQPAGAGQPRPLSGTAGHERRIKEGHVRQIERKSRPVAADHLIDAPVRSGPERHVEAWRAWSDCGDGGRVHLILDRQAQQLWLLPSDETLIDPRSMG